MRALVDVYYGLQDFTWGTKLIEVPVSTIRNLNGSLKILGSEEGYKQTALGIFKSQVMEEIEGNVCFIGVYHFEYDNNEVE
jgi:hypothetical protein